MNYKFFIKSILLSILLVIFGAGCDRDEAAYPSVNNSLAKSAGFTEVHNFTSSGTSSDFYSIVGNLSTSKGTVTYSGLTLTQCLKIESSTSISFTSAASATLKLVFNSSFSKNIKIDGTKYAASSGIVEVELGAGSHEITKADSANLYYMSLSSGSGGSDDSNTGDDSNSDDSNDDSNTDSGNSTSDISITEIKGWLESASVKWQPVSGASGYKVYYKTSSSSSYKELDNQLIRKYGSYYRADVLGVPEGTCQVKVVPIINGKEAGSSSKSVSVKAHIREGFAFSSKSPMKTGSGGYNDDGSVPSDAQILYLTKDNANSITLEVVTSSSGKTQVATGIADILALRKKGYDKKHLIIRMIGQVDDSDIDGINSKGYLELKGIYNTTLEGVGEDATVYGWGILVRDAHNVEVRNLGVMLFPDDGISLDTDNENIWVHNNDIFYGTAGSDSDQAKGDGSCDVKTSDYITVSYNHFFDSGKCSLCGMKDTEEFHVTYHHNWFDHSDSRHPRIRVGTIHIYNNYFDGNSKYGVGVTKGSSAFVEANYFRHCKYPMMSSLQGTDIKYAGGTFSDEAGGMIKAYNNTIEDAKSIIYAQDDSTQFDAYLASSRNETVSSSYKTVSGGTTYNNFDTASSMYSYSPLSPSQVKANVTTYSGRINGGDFTWEFSNSDDTSYEMDSELMSKIRSYTTELVSVGGVK